MFWIIQSIHLFLIVEVFQPSVKLTAQVLLIVFSIWSNHLQQIQNWFVKQLAQILSQQLMQKNQELSILNTSMWIASLLSLAPILWQMLRNSILTVHLALFYAKMWLLHLASHYILCTLTLCTPHIHMLYVLGQHLVKTLSHSWIQYISNAHPAMLASTI